MGYKFQFITLAGIHSMWHGMFNLANEYVVDGMTAYVKLQEKEFEEDERKWCRKIKVEGRTVVKITRL